MKKLLTIIFLCLSILCSVQAQTILNGSQWWDGSVLYTAKVNGNSVTMNGVGEHEGGFIFHLTKLEGKEGEYILTGAETEAMALRAKVGWRVQYIRQDGMYFLAIRKPNGDAVWQMTLTPDDLRSSLAFEQYLEKQPVSEQLSNCLLNTTYLARFSKDELRLMRNEILARHGWKFQSKDLQEHFGKQSWYKPGNNNNAIKLHIIEQLNIQLIKSEETVPDEERGYRDFSSGPEYNSELRALVNGQEGQFPGGLDDDGRGPDEVDGEAYYSVTNESEFIAAMGSNRTVVVAAGVHLNLSRVLEREEMFRNQPGRRWASIASDFIGSEPLVISESETDGQQLALVNIKNLVIKGERNSSIEVDPRYSYCIYFINCENCEVHNLTMGHTEGGYCSGGVIGVKGGRMFLVKDCDLYGCGTYGLDLMGTSDFSLFNSNIHDCTYGIMQLRNSTAVMFNHCDFFNNREYTLIEGINNQGLTFNDCRFFANWGDAPLFGIEQTFYLNDCMIYHPTERLGTINNASQQNCKFFANPFDNSIQGRDFGPK
jgi:hypothetical protein